jgi:ATP adenylyltransferase
MRYVGGGAKEAGCLFCNRLAGDDDVGGLILHRSERAFVIMNLFPYNTGHVMVVPNDHIASPEAADQPSLTEMAALLAPVLRALRRALTCDGFNLGMNVGTVAGAGVADHLHQHVVPRWQGDANFMPILAATMVLPELIPVTYAKLRAEIAREIWGASQVALVILSCDNHDVLVGADGRLPVVEAHPAESLWRAASQAAEQLGGIPATIEGWAGARGATGGPVGLTLRVLDRAESGPASPLEWRAVTAAESGLDGRVVNNALTQLAMRASVDAM